MSVNTIEETSRLSPQLRERFMNDDSEEKDAVEKEIDLKMQ